MVKSFTIKSLNPQINAEYVAADYGKRQGMGKFKGWELWEIRRIHLNCRDTLDYYLAVKDDVCIVDHTFTNILEELTRAEK